MVYQPLKARILQHDGMAPRYTSYPPAPAFQTGFSPDNLANWLGALTPPQTLSLYVHIPFCAKLCYYCGCHTSIANNYDRIADYLVSLHSEIDLAAHTLADGVGTVHVHFGGGSPTMLADTDFTDLVTHLRGAFHITKDAEIAIEADPRQLTRSRIETYARNGISRISLGVQDFDETVLKTVNREQPHELTANAMQWAREAGIKGINMDIMYGLPCQTLATQEQTLEKVIALSPDRVAFFGYAHVPWMKKHMSVIGEGNLPGPDLRYDLFEAGSKALTAAGYHAIGIDHFVRGHDPMYQAYRSGLLKRNFQGYTTDSADALLGLGASAISSFPQGYSQNFADLRAYADAVRSGVLPATRGIGKTHEDIVRSHVIMGIMCDFEIDLADITRIYDLPAHYFDADCARLALLVNDGLVAQHGRRISVNRSAPHIARMAAMAFDRYVPGDPGLKRHSRTV